MCQNAVGQKKIEWLGIWVQRVYDLYDQMGEALVKKSSKNWAVAGECVCVCGGGGGGGRQVADGGVIIHILPGGAAQAFKSSDTNK